MASNTNAVEAGSFIEPMECLLTGTLPEGPGWSYELKLDGFRLQAARAGFAFCLYSRRGNLLNARFPSLVDDLASIPDGTVLDGELVALGDDGRPDLQRLQNFRGGPRIVFSLSIHSLMVLLADQLRTDELRPIGLKLLHCIDHRCILCLQSFEVCHRSPPGTGCLSLGIHALDAPAGDRAY